jgi:DNA polymerase-3 subunit alpha
MIYNRHMSRAGFTHLHVHSHYSLLEALPKIPNLIERAKQDGQTALALTDNGNLYGAIEFYKECTKAGIKPIIGVDFFVAPRTRHDKEHRVDDQTTRLVLLAKNFAGYRNLLSLVTKSHLEGFYYRPRIDRELLEMHREGLIAILPSFGGEHARAIKDGNIEPAKESLAWHKKIFGNDVYAEITRHKEIEGHEERMKMIVELARRERVEPVATADIYYLDEDDATARELVNKIRTGSVLTRDPDGRAGESGDFSFKTQKEMQKMFSPMPEALENTAKIADACMLELSLGKAIFPQFPIPDGSTDNDELRKLVDIGMKERDFKMTSEIKARIEYELGIIAQKGYASYFLIVGDLLASCARSGHFYQHARQRRRLLVSYLCGITTVDPIAFNMPFERFLNPERPSAPDIDMDIADNRRDELIEYARKKYGEDHVVQIGTFGTMMARAAVRDVARALGHFHTTRAIHRQS